MAPASNEEQFKFLISCIRYSNNGKVDFGQVAKECKIVSKGAAAKRYERMMRAHGIAPNAASIKPTPVRAKVERRESGTSSSTSKKRKADAFLEENLAEDDEGFGNVKPEPMNMKEHFVVKDETEQKAGQPNIRDAVNLMQYYDAPNSFAGTNMGMGQGQEEYNGSEYTDSAGYHTPIGGSYSMEDDSFQYYGGHGFGDAGMGGSFPTSEDQGAQYQPMMGFNVDNQGGSDAPVVVE